PRCKACRPANARWWCCATSVTSAKTTSPRLSASVPAASAPTCSAVYKHCAAASATTSKDSTLLSEHPTRDELDALAERVIQRGYRLRARRPLAPSRAAALLVVT